MLSSSALGGQRSRPSGNAKVIVVLPFDVTSPIYPGIPFSGVTTTVFPVLSKPDPLRVICVPIGP